MNENITKYIIRGRYKVIDEIAKGSFGTVYITRDLQTNYLYAIKILHSKYTRNTEIVTRFQREASLPLNISNPHIVRVVDFGLDNDIYFIVMDYIDGHSLRLLMTTRGPLPVLVGLDYAQQIARGLDAAYQQQVVHRDLKPQNIIVNNRDEVKITDFGLARSKETPTITDTAEFMGTAYYISPEQIDSGHAADIRSDLYSAAAIFFEMLTGNPPFRGDTVMDLILKHKNGHVPSVRTKRPDLPPDMDHFFQKALAKLPMQRFQTPQEFLQALEQLQRIFQPVQPPIPPIPSHPAEAMPQASVQGPLRSQTAHPQPVPIPAPIPLSVPSSGVRASSPTNEEPPTDKPEPPNQACRLVDSASGEVFLLNREALIIGRRDPTRNIFPDISLADKMVGRHHARVWNRHGLYTVEDLHSRNKTRLNGEILQPHSEQPLKEGDIIRVGSIELRFEIVQ